VSTGLRILAVFSLLSVLGFGGGKGIIPQLHADSVSHYHWITNAQFTEFYTIGKLVPGPTTIMATLIGFAAGGFGMAALATAAMFVPAAILMFVATSLWTRMPQSRLKAAITGGLAPVIIGLVWSSVLSVGKGVPLGIPTFGIIAVVAALSLWTKLSAPLLILGGGAAGLLFLHFP
jgi:chromate transporter